MNKIAAALGAAFIFVATSFAQTYTPNLQLTLPPYLSPNWNTAMNGNFTIIDNAFGQLQSAFQGSWASTSSYTRGQIVNYSGSLYISLINSNFNNTPSATSAAWSFMVSGAFADVYEGVWSSATAYRAGQVVNYNGSSYLSLQNNNLNQIPSSSSAYWGVLSTTAAAGAPGAIQYTTPAGAIGGASVSGLLYSDGADAPTEATPANIESSLGYTPAHSGENSDITSLSGLTAPLTIGQGGTGANTPSGAASALGVLPLTGGTLTGPIAFSGGASGSAAQTTLANLGGFSLSGGNITGAIITSLCPQLGTSSGSGAEVCLNAAPYYASGSNQTTTATGTNAAGTSINVASCADFTSSGAGAAYGHQGVAIAGAGASGALYIGTVSGCSGGVLTLASATSTSISSSSTTATYTLGTNTITVASAAGIEFGDTIVSADVPTPTFVIGVSGTTVYMSNQSSNPGSSVSTMFSPTVMHDETAALQGAINYIGESVGRGIIDVVGYNRINGPLQDTSYGNAQILFPSLPYLYTPNVPAAAITIRGVGYPSIGCVNCAVFQTLSPSGNLFGALNHTAGGSQPFTNIALDMENIVLRDYPNPGVTLLNGNNLVQMILRNVMCDSGDNIGEFGPLVYPTNTNGVCAYYPHIGNNVTNVADNLWSSAQYTGAVVAEHTQVRSLFALSNYTALELNGTSAANEVFVDTLWCQVCTDTVAATSQTTAQIQAFDSEALQSGGYDFYDPNNYVFGNVNLHALGHTPAIDGGTNANVCSFGSSTNMTCTASAGSTNNFQTLSAGYITAPVFHGTASVSIAPAGANVSAATPCPGAYFSTSITTGCITFTTSGSPTSGPQVAIAFAAQNHYVNPTLTNGSGATFIGTYEPTAFGGNLTGWDFAFLTAPPANTTFTFYYNTGQ